VVLLIMAESIKKSTVNRLFVDTQYMQGKIVGNGATVFGQQTYNIKIIYGAENDGRLRSVSKEIFTNVKMAACDPSRGDALEIGDTVIVAFLGKDYNNPMIVTASGKITQSGNSTDGPSDGASNKSKEELANSDFESGEQLKNTTFINPVPGSTRGSGFGPRNGRQHNGVDLQNVYGTQIYASASGKISYLTQDGGTNGWGYYVQIDHGNGLTTRYAHCGPKTNSGDGVAPTADSWNLYEKGTDVKQGDLIAYMGSTGSSTGSHLHFEIVVDGKYVDPAPYIFGD
jgi:murein DD-endopeptidase MepM/ murein hydrolase activator NlpD